MPLEAIIKAIEEEARKQAQAILSEAEQRADKILASARDEARKVGQFHFEQKVKECQKDADQKISAARLQARNQLLQIQEEWIRKVFAEAERQLQNLEAPQYREWMRKQIVANCQAEEVEIILAKRDQKRLGRSWEAEIRKALQHIGVGKKIKFRYEEGRFRGGFILRTAQYDVAFTFEALLKQLCGSLQFRIHKVLFGEDKNQ